MAGCDGYAVGEVDERLLPLVHRWFEMEYVQPSARQMTLFQKFQECGSIYNIAPGRVDEIGAFTHHTKSFRPEKPVSLRFVRDMDCDNVGPLEEVLDGIREFVG